MFTRFATTQAADRSDRVVTAAEEQPMTGTGPLIRPLTPADRPALADFPGRVSAASANFRFHGSLTMLTDKTLDLLLDLADGQREATIAVDDRGIAGVARFARDDLDPATAEVAILVADEWQHRGLARQHERLGRTMAHRHRRRTLRLPSLPGRAHGPGRDRRDHRRRGRHRLGWRRGRQLHPRHHHSVTY
jgi:hypothetical protein